MDTNTIRAILAADVQTFPKKGAVMLNWKSFEDGSNTYSLSVTDLETNNQLIGKTGTTRFQQKAQKSIQKIRQKKQQTMMRSEDETDTDTAPS